MMNFFITKTHRKAYRDIITPPNCLPCNTLFSSIFSLILLLSSFSLKADDIDNISSNNSKLFLGVGAGEGGGAHGGSFKAYRLSYQKTLSSNNYYNFDYISDIGLNYWKDDSRLSESDKLTATSDLDTSNVSISYSRIIRKYIAKNTFFDIGAGLSLHNNDSMYGSDMGTAYQFESRIGLGYERETYRSIVNFFHYSNGGVKRENDGVDIIMLSIAKYF